MLRPLKAVQFLFTVLALFRMPDVNAVVIFPTNAVWKYLKGTSEASSPDAAAWRAVEFDDAPWPSGPAAFYYGETLTGTFLPDMANNYTCIFLRQKFTVTNANQFGTLVLTESCGVTTRPSVVARTAI